MSYGLAASTAGNLSQREQRGPIDPILCQLLGEFWPSEIEGLGFTCAKICGTVFFSGFVPLFCRGPSFKVQVGFRVEDLGLSFLHNNNQTSFLLFGF